MAATAKSGYTNGSDLLLMIDGKPVGHCTTHTITYNTETKDRAVKPVATAPVTAGLWKEKGVTGLSVSISAEGLMVYDETEGALRHLMAAYNTGAPVEVKGFERGQDAEPYLSGSFVIASLEQQAPAQDDVTYSISLENNGQVSLDATKITNGTAA